MNQQSSEKILVFIPMHNCEKQIGRVLAQFAEIKQAELTEIIVIDNQSTDNSVAVAETSLKTLQHLNAKLLKNDDSYGLGGSHKVAFEYAIKHQFDYCIVLHGDDQGDIKDLMPYLKTATHHHYDCLLGARFMPNSVLTGYPLFRILGNKIYNFLYSTVCRRRLYDLGAGLNIYKVSFLKQLDFSRFADDLTFNYHAILATVAKKANFKFFPLTWRKDDQISHVKLIQQAWLGLNILYLFAKNKNEFITHHFATTTPNGRYSTTIIYEHTR